MKRAISSIGCSITYFESTPQGNVFFAITQKLNHYEYSFTVQGDYETLPLISVFLLFLPSAPSLFIPLSQYFYSLVSEHFLSLDFVAFNYFCRTGEKFRLSICTVWKIECIIISDLLVKEKIKFLAIHIWSSFAKGQYIVYTESLLLMLGSILLFWLFAILFICCSMLPPKSIICVANLFSQDTAEINIRYWLYRVFLLRLCKVCIVKNRNDSFLV